jgi:hypothetical protein
MTSLYSTKSICSVSNVLPELVEKPKSTKPECNVCIKRCKKVYKEDYLKSIDQKIYFCSQKCFEIHSKFVCDGTLDLFTCFKEIPDG